MENKYFTFATIIVLAALQPFAVLGGFSQPSNSLEKNRKIEYKINSVDGGGAPSRPLSPTKLKLQGMFLPKTKTTDNNVLNVVKADTEEIEDMDRFVSVLRHKKELKVDERDKSFESDDTVLEDDDAGGDYGDHEIEEEEEEGEGEKRTGHRSKRSLWDWLFGYDHHHHHHGGHYSRRWWPARRQHHRHWRSNRH